MKNIQIDGVGLVTLKKSRRAKRVILKFNQKGEPIVTVPFYAAYSMGEKFAQQNRGWLIKNSPIDQKVILHTGDQIGRSHVIEFTASTKLASRVGKTVVTVNYPKNLHSSDATVQTEAQKAATRALRRQAESVLPSLLHELATKYNYKYREVRVKNVHTRWGSCSNHGVINLSIWLMQLPDSLIEYVLCHELTHLSNMNHSTSFWQELARMVPDYKMRRKALKEFHPRLMKA